jgi:hypothetical protein
MYQHDIIIHWGNKPTYNRHRVALAIQDAINPRAIARELVKVVEAAAETADSTSAICKDPAVVLVVSKLESLIQSEDRFADAYHECQIAALAAEAEARQQPREPQPGTTQPATED